MSTEDGNSDTVFWPSAGRQQPQRSGKRLNEGTSLYQDTDNSCHDSPNPPSFHCVAYNPMHSSPILWSQISLDEEPTLRFPDSTHMLGY